MAKQKATKPKQKPRWVVSGRIEGTASAVVFADTAEEAEALFKDGETTDSVEEWFWTSHDTPEQIDGD